MTTPVSHIKTPGNKIIDPKLGNPEESTRGLCTVVAVDLDTVPATYTCKVEGSRHARTFTDADRERLQPVPVEPILDFDIDCFVGRRVRLRSNYGELTGRLERIERYKLVVEDRTVLLPLNLILDGDPMPFHQVKDLRLA